jgi:hypothetical protein
MKAEQMKNINDDKRMPTGIERDAFVHSSMRLRRNQKTISKPNHSWTERTKRKSMRGTEKANASLSSANPAHDSESEVEGQHLAAKTLHLKLIAFHRLTGSFCITLPHFFHSCIPVNRQRFSQKWEY